MPIRARLAMMLAATLVLTAALAVVLLAGGNDRSAGQGFEGSLPPAPVPPVAFALKDETGHVRRLADYRGRPVIVTFMYSTCRDTCPLTAQQIKIAMDDLGHDVPALAVSVDPVNDTPLNAKRFLVKQGLLGRMHFLLGDRAQLSRIWHAFGIQPQGKAFDHSAYVLLIDRHGRWKVSWPVQELRPEGLAHDLRLLGAV
jgi:protein SCO1